MDIRRFFSPVGSSSKEKARKDAAAPVAKKGTKSPTESKTKAKKRPSLLIESDSEEEEKKKNASAKKKGNTSKKEAELVIEGDDDSDAELQKKKKRQPNGCKEDKSKLKPITVSEYFGGEGGTEKTDKKGPLSRKRKATEVVLDVEGVAKKQKEAKEKQPEEVLVKAKKQTEGAKLVQETKEKQPEEVPAKTKKQKEGAKPVQEEASKERPLSAEAKKEGAAERPKATEEEISQLKASAEKKRANFLSYKQFQERDGPRALGSKTFPKGKEGCLHGLTFVLTGVLESFERDDVKERIEKYGGRVVQSVSKKTSYLVVGRDAGQSKLSKAEQLGTKTLDEDGLLSLVAASAGQEEEIPEVKRKTPRKAKASQQQVAAAPPAGEGAMWVDKYRPTSTQQIIGQQGDRSIAKKLANWLKNWHVSRGKNVRRPAWGAGQDDGSAFKAALLSGPPGVGKTTTAHLVCKEAGFTFVELNASDQRSKNALKEEIAGLVGNRTLFADGGSSTTTQKHAIVMDEVDGMSGNEDRGGVQELIGLIKASKVPIVCICNDRSHPKIRSLANYCYDLRFFRPRVEQIKGALMSIAYKEGVKVPPSVLHDIIVASNQDVRQVLHNLCVWSSATKGLTAEQAKRDVGLGVKDVRVSPFDALRHVFQHKEGVRAKAELFFSDYSLMPLFVHENYLHVSPREASGNTLNHLRLVSAAADSICEGDMVDRMIRRENAWGLLPTQAIFSTVVPGDLLEGHLSGMITFPSWLGRNSARGRTDRLVQDLHVHARLRISGSKTDVAVDYIRPLRDAIVRPLLEDDGVREALQVVERYCLLREDVDNLVEVGQWPGQKDPMSGVPPKVKAAFTRAYNRGGIKTPYSVTKNKAKRAAKQEGEEGDEEEEEEDDDVASDAMVKVKQPSKKEEGPSKVKRGGKRR